jgi:exodeoxyribonuclease III
LATVLDVRIATWNINSLKVRLFRVEEWLQQVQPDVLCLQETKLADSAYPALSFEALGYHSAHFGQGQWNGVAIISRLPMTDVVANFASGIEPDPEARILSATCGGVRVTSVYVPNGRSLDHEHYQYKLDWMARLRRHVEVSSHVDEPVIVCGDFNIAPADIDVWKLDKFEGATHVSPPERDRLRELCDWGLVDVVRERYPDDKIYSWWDYRGGDFHMGRGLRIDLVLASKPLADKVSWAVIDRNARKGTQPSDHAPVVIDVDWP